MFVILKHMLHYSCALASAISIAFALIVALLSCCNTSNSAFPNDVHTDSFISGERYRELGLFDLMQRDRTIRDQRLGDGSINGNSAISLAGNIIMKGTSPWRAKCVIITARTASDFRQNYFAKCIQPSIQSAWKRWEDSRQTVIDAVKSSGADCVRLHVSQPALDPYFGLGAGEGTLVNKQTYLDKIVDDTLLIRQENNNLTLILDMQAQPNTGWNDDNSCGGKQQTTPTYGGTAPVKSSSVDAWKALALRFSHEIKLKNDLGIIFELFNEPSDPSDDPDWPLQETWDDWRDRHQALFNVIREIETKNNLFERVLILQGLHAGKALVPNPVNRYGLSYKRKDGKLAGSTPLLHKGENYLFSFHMFANSAFIPTNNESQLMKAFGDFCRNHPCLATAMGENRWNIAMGDLCPHQVVLNQLNWLKNYSYGGRKGLGATIFAFDASHNYWIDPGTYTTKTSMASGCGKTCAGSDCDLLCGYSWPDYSFGMGMTFWEYTKNDNVKCL